MNLDSRNMTVANELATKLRYNGSKFSLDCFMDLAGHDKLKLKLKLKGIF